MAETVSCPDCGAEFEKIDELEKGGELPEIESGEGGTINLFENRDLFLCKNCKNPLGVSRSKR